MIYPIHVLLYMKYKARKGGIGTVNVKSHCFLWFQPARSKPQLIHL